MLDDPAFETWLKEVDRHIQSRIGLTHEDIGDQLYRDWWESGMRAEEAANDALTNEGFLDG